MERVEHPIPPVYNKDSKILVLGSFPSVKSREGEFFYHHPQNRFWKVISMIYEEPLPITIEDKKLMLLQHKIAVWDVIQSCEIIGSSDNSIKNVVANDLSNILANTEILRIFVNGSTAYQLYHKYIFPKVGTEAVKLPSTSPANANCKLDCLLREWSQIKSYTN